MTHYLDTLSQSQDTLTLYTSAITRAHGTNHPEVFKVQDLYHAILKQGDLSSQADQLWQDMWILTNHFAIPSDVCPTFEKTYQHLAHLYQLFQHDKEEQ